MSDNRDIATSVCATTNGGYIVGGFFKSNQLQVSNQVLSNNLPENTISGYGDGFIIKYNSTNQVEWTRTMGGTRDDDTITLCGTSAGGCIVSFYCSSNNGQSFNIDEYSFPKGCGIVKYASNGDIEWVTSNNIQINNVYETSDGGCLLAGEFYSTTEIDGHKINGNYEEGIFFKYNYVGEKEWYRVICGQSYERVYCVCETTEGSYIAAGMFDSDYSFVRKHNP